MGSRHIPVLVEEVMGFLQCEPGRTYADATLGGGGHAFEILRRSSPDGRLIGLEWDETAIGEARNVLTPYGEDRVRIFQENFARLPGVLKEVGIDEVDGILFDLGLSSLQLDQQGRGFSFQAEGPLDMRMDRRRDLTAADFVNTLSQAALEETLSHYGEERWAKRIAKAIVQEREKRPILTTQALKTIVHQAIPRRFHSRRLDPATRTFQAFRIRVNDELENLKVTLQGAWKLLRKGGRICVISFHSLEDRIVKETFREQARKGGEGSGSDPILRILTPKPVTPSEEEKKGNPRSRSAKLRCSERV
jgi:16S rRNA (cytosine1402-N4)-methyltransferase